MTNARSVSDRLAELLRREHHALADFLVALADFDRRRLWEELGHANLFAFLHRELGLSRGSAFYRKVAAELVQRHPEVIEPLRDGRLCLTSVVELAKVLTVENRDEVLPRFFHRSKQEAKAISAELRPQEAPPRRDVVTAVGLSGFARVEPVETRAVPATLPSTGPARTAEVSRGVQPDERVRANSLESSRALPPRPAPRDVAEPVARRTGSSSTTWSPWRMGAPRRSPTSESFANGTTSSLRAAPSETRGWAGSRGPAVRSSRSRRDVTNPEGVTRRSRQHGLEVVSTIVTKGTSRSARRSGFDEAVTAAFASSPSRRARADLERGLGSLRVEGVHSFETLMRAIPRIQGLPGRTAIRLLEARGRMSTPALVRLLALGDEQLAVDASKALAKLGGVHARRGCIRVLGSDAPHLARYAATYALAFMRDDEAARTLAKLVLDPGEDPQIRGQAAEGLDHFGREGGPHRRLAVRAALRGLDDPSPVVRFWCAFALGAMPYPPAIPALRKLARRDRAVCPGWWRVCDEAADAIAVMEGRFPPDRMPPARGARTPGS